MTKKDIVSKIAEETNIKQLDVKKVVQRTLDHIVASLANSQTVELRNFGVFKIRTRKGRMGRNPRTGDQVPIPEKRVVSFKAGLVMKQKVLK